MAERLALEGGRPVRATFLPFHQPWIDQAAIKGVVDVLESGWLTRGPKTEAFEAAFRDYIGCRQAVALNSCTAGLHLVLVALGTGPGDEVITSPVSFPSSANVIVHVGATPVFADVEPATLNLDPRSVARRITPRTRAIIPVHLAGHPCEMDPLLDLAQAHSLAVVEDAAHAIEATYRGRKVGTLGTAAAFSYYATKNLTTGEGGMLTTNDEALAERVRLLSLHGISRDAWRRYAPDGPLEWETVAPGFKYNMFDLQAVLGLHQLPRLEERWQRREELVRYYRQALVGLPELSVLEERPGIRHGYHLFIVLLNMERLRVSRAQIMMALRAEGIGVGVHFSSLHHHDYYHRHHPQPAGTLPVADRVSGRVLSLPLYPQLTRRDLDDVVSAVWKILRAYST